MAIVAMIRGLFLYGAAVVLGGWLLSVLAWSCFTYSYFLSPKMPTNTTELSTWEFFKLKRLFNGTHECYKLHSIYTVEQRHQADKEWRKVCKIIKYYKDKKDIAIIAHGEKINNR